MRTSLVLVLAFASLAHAEDPLERARREEHQRVRAEEDAQRAQQAQREAAARRLQQRQQQVNGALADSRAALQSVPVMQRHAPGVQVLWSHGLTARQQQVLRQVTQAGGRVTSVAFAPKGGGFVVVWNRNDFVAEGVEKALTSSLARAREQNQEVRAVSISPSGGWYFVTGEHNYVCDGLPRSAWQSLARLAGEGQRLGPMGFTKDGFIIVYGRNYRVAENVPQSLVTSVDTLASGFTYLHSLALRSDGEYVASVQGAYTYHSEALPRDLLSFLSQCARDNRELTMVALSPSGGWVALGQY